VVNIQLASEQLARLDTISKIDLGFPGEFYKEDGVKLANFGGFYDEVEKR
jgi:hypothetical protein